ncbi:hypothetical protein CEXT_341771 [Caerostris extrusa]|uniref:Uncharacterized protein n=1 Tax=Caerostris extrusa TaxID=172846 RepID=A0AAV4QUC0_CAEEX|nr:hypothetical protein CEXT_341771 [Caerostris extrusa]
MLNIVRQTPHDNDGSRSFILTADTKLDHCFRYPNVHQRFLHVELWECARFLSLKTIKLTGSNRLINTVDVITIGS